MLMSILNINYAKFALVPIYCEESWKQEAFSMLQCGVHDLPVIYLGIPLEVNLRKIATWKPVLEKVEKRLALWKGKTLSRVGRLTLIKSVLNNLLMYYLNLFKIPKIVAKRLIQMQ